MLIIDDADWHRDALDGFFRKLGYDTTVCNDAPAAMAEYLAHEHDYFESIVTDISMWLPQHRTRVQRLWLGELAGWHLCKQLRKRGFVGRLVVASTAADKALGRFLLAVTLGPKGVAWLVDKRKIKSLGDAATLDAVCTRNRVFGAKAPQDRS